MIWNNLTIGKKIGAGFGLLLLLLCIASVFSFSGVREIVGNAQKVIAGNRLDGNLAQKEVDHLNWAKKVNALLTDRRVKTLEVQLDHSQCAFGKWLYGDDRKAAEGFIPSLAPVFKEIEEPHKKLHESAKSIKEVFVPADVSLPALLVARKNDHLLWADKVRDALLSGSRSLEVETDPTRCALGKWLATGEAKSVYEKGDKEFKQAWDSMAADHDKLHGSAINVQKALSTSTDEAVRLFQSEVAPLLEATLAQLDTLHAESEHEIKGMLKANAIFASETQPALDQVQALLAKIRTEAKKHVMTDEIMLASAQHTQRNVVIAASVAILTGIFLAFFVSRNVVVALKKVIDLLSAGGEQVASAAEQVSASSQSLAEGASEQASSLEESSSALEELASMTKQNAANSGQAKNHMEATTQVVQTANQSMTDLTGSMQAINTASVETSKIIKTIDEIAFQTNLLALNAAVEAARAGEAGAGFAVVADEVRNLAMRAADAAKNTSGLIEDTLKKVSDGSSLVQKTNQAFTEVSSSVSKVSELIAEITAASSEQAQGIDQVNTAVSEMDKITQQNAANAEESASASEELSAQSLQMKQIVDDLGRMVGKAKNTGVETKAGSKEGLLKRVISKSGKIGAAAANPVRPGQVFKGVAQEIPFDEDLKNF